MPDVPASGAVAETGHDSTPRHFGLVILGGKRCLAIVTLQAGDPVFQNRPLFGQKKLVNAAVFRQRLCFDQIEVGQLLERPVKRLPG